MASMLDKIFGLEDEVAIVTGGGRGIGLCLAEHLVRAGARVVIADMLEKEGEAAAELLTNQGLRAEYARVDVTNRASVQGLVDGIVSRHGRLDVLINCAGIIRRSPLTEATDDEWKLSMDVNLYGVFLCSQIAGREMLKQKKGRIVNIASIVAQVAQRDQGIYAVSKAGVAHLTRVMAFEWAHTGVRVNAIAPGPTMTDLTKAYFDQNPDVLADRLKSIPLGRLGKPEDFAGAALYLSSGASDFMTGQILWVDGGFLLA